MVYVYKNIDGNYIKYIISFTKYIRDFTDVEIFYLHTYIHMLIEKYIWYVLDFE